MNQHEVTSQGNVWLLNIEGAPIAPEDHCTVAGKVDIISGCDETGSTLPRVADSKRNRCHSRSKSDNLDYTATTLCMVLSEMLPGKRNREKMLGQVLEEKEIQ